MHPSCVATVSECSPPTCRDGAAGPVGAHPSAGSYRAKSPAADDARGDGDITWIRKSKMANPQETFIMSNSNVSQGNPKDGDRSKDADRNKSGQQSQSPGQSGGAGQSGGKNPQQTGGQHGGQGQQGSQQGGGQSGGQAGQQGGQHSGQKDKDQSGSGSR